MAVSPSNETPHQHYKEDNTGLMKIFITVRVWRVNQMRVISILRSTVDLKIETRLRIFVYIRDSKVFNSEQFNPIHNEIRFNLISMHDSILYFLSEL